MMGLGASQQFSQTFNFFTFHTKKKLTKNLLKNISDLEEKHHDGNRYLVDHSLIHF